MTNDGSGRLFEVPHCAGGEPFEMDGLRQRTDFQSRAPRSGADLKEMAIHRLIEAGATVERVDFEVDRFPVDAQVCGRNRRSLEQVLQLVADAVGGGPRSMAGPATTLHVDNPGQPLSAVGIGATGNEHRPLSGRTPGSGI